MKKIIITAFLFCFTFLSFLTCGKSSKDPFAEASPEDPIYENPVGEQEYEDVPLAPGAVEMSPSLRQLIGVRLAAVKKKPITYTLRLYGRVVPDETRTYRVNASTDCWIRQITDVTTGSIVKKDEILAEALAPSYYNAQQTYLIALDNVDRIRKQLGGELRHQQRDLANNQIRVAVQALQNLGITDAQTEELANTRRARPYLQVRAPADGVVLSRDITLNQWFKEAEQFYTIADINKVWVYADVYEDEAMYMSPGMKVSITHKQTGKTFSAEVAKVLPLFDPAARTIKLRIDVDNPDYDLRPDMFVDVEIPLTMPPALNIPANAVIDSGTRKIVYVERGEGAFEPRLVETGWRLGGRVEIKHGLAPGEKIALSGNFLIDSESQLMTAGLGSSSGMAVDPVSGRFVDQVEAEMFEMVSAYEGTTYYFSSDWSKTEFDIAPEEYINKNQVGGKKETVTVMPATNRSWAEMLDAGRSGENAEGPRKIIKVTKDAPISNYPITPDFIDWEGGQKEGEPPPKWEKGWGGFPGARYLGIKPEESDDIDEPEDIGDDDAASEPVAPVKTETKSQEEILKDLGNLTNRKPESTKDKQPESGAQP